MKLSIDRLRVLALVARTGSISGAAKELDVGVSAVSQQISHLEEELGTDLFERSTRPARLTPLGVTLASHGTNILEEFERAISVVEQTHEIVGGRFDVASIPTIAASVITDALLELQTFAPNLDIRVHDLEASQSLQSLATHDIDMTVIDTYEGIPRAFPEDMTVIDLGTEPVQLLCPKNLISPVTSNKTVKLEMLEHLPWVMPPSSATCGAAVMRLCRAAGFEPNIKLETNDLQLLRAFVEKGFCLTALPRVALIDPPPSCVVLDISGTPTRSLHALTRVSTNDRPSEKVIIEALKTAASKYLDNPKESK